MNVGNDCEQFDAALVAESGKEPTRRGESCSHVDAEHGHESPPGDLIRVPNTQFLRDLYVVPKMTCVVGIPHIKMDRRFWWPSTIEVHSLPCGASDTGDADDNGCR